LTSTVPRDEPGFDGLEARRARTPHIAFLLGAFVIGFGAASGIALVTSVASLGGFAGPFAAGFVWERRGSLCPGLTSAFVSLLLSGALALVSTGKGHYQRDSLLSSTLPDTGGGPGPFPRLD
jgi:hypothetical protein